MQIQFHVQDITHLCFQKFKENNAITLNNKYSLVGEKCNTILSMKEVHQTNDNLKKKNIAN